ncbi:hypothetical protein HUS70_19425 [Pandoraea nosoerga]|uniref:hypothetical protein n=1 Tax=Pandoraea TaxID=93217 RepID=UPI0012427E4B|nr:MULTISPECIES: hypothetical protein [Pandoraea]MBN4667373.1 hypothetical protein [Pandoraea nosoerga]MBN4677311.1 hypothetical protein [Pandoraea nosoerga]MBN4682432.1 hypothetical protein [Pandoraea nosoerga]MBN4746771.1 hypothetical protein [Pandoraea nosoerga]
MSVHLTGATRNEVPRPSSGEYLADARREKHGRRVSIEGAHVDDEFANYRKTPRALGIVRMEMTDLSEIPLTCAQNPWHA